MAADLTTSPVDRQNILNNPEALDSIQEFLGITGMLYDRQYRFTTAQLAEFFDVSDRTVKRYVENHLQELEHNGYCVLRGAKLKEFKELFGPLIYKDIDQESQRDIDVPLSTEQTDKQKLNRLKALAVFNFRAFLNLAMILVDSERAKSIRSAILDVVLDLVNKKLGGSVKYINQRDDEFLLAIVKEPKYRKEFTSALSRYLNMGNVKYKLYTDAIYQAIFKEKASEYKELLQLDEKDNVRETMYAEVLKLIASFEIGIADEMKEEYDRLGRLLEPTELDALIHRFVNRRHWEPQLEDVRVKMASRDYGFRDVVHKKLERYIDSISPDDYQKFLGEQSKSLQEQIDENIEVFKRLKDR